MSLATYKKKRSFDQTPEPTGGTTGKKDLTFVIQKHDASHLHYDFRLEMDGVLKSWAIPKGPSLNPADKRLAMMVEDHPFDYKDFEGIIPEGNYGAGTVMVWDTGTYEPLHETSGTKMAQNKELLKELKSGQLKIRLNGKKLKGEFALVQTRGRGDNSWLLIKHKDKYASETPVIEKDKSVISKKTLEQIAKSPKSATWESNKKTSKKETAAAPVRQKTQKTKTKAMLGEGDSQQATINGHKFDFTHLDKIFWPKEKYTKRDLLNYYDQVAPFMLPYLKDRPHSLNRHPNGITGQGFYQK